MRSSPLGVIVAESGMRNQPMIKQPYVAPRVVALGTVRDVVLGTAQHDTADMNTARYW
jgi:hypothetical protein